MPPSKAQFLGNSPKRERKRGSAIYEEFMSWLQATEELARERREMYFLGDGRECYEETPS